MKYTLVLALILLASSFSSQANLITTLGVQGPQGSLVSVNSNGWDTVTDSFVPVFDGDYLRSRSPGSNLTITFSNLPYHTGISVGLLVAQLNSLDPIRDGDTFDILIDGVQIIRVGLGFGSSGQFFDPIVSNYIVNGVNSNEQLVLDTQIWSLDNTFDDHAYDFGKLDALQNIAHTDSDISLTIIGRSGQGWNNEAYAIDNLSLSLVGVPSPAAFSIFVFGLLGLIFRKTSWLG